MRRWIMVLAGTFGLLLAAAGVAGAGGGGHGVGDCDAFRVGGDLRLLDSCFDGTAHFTEAGTTLTVRNEGSVGHTVTAADGSFDSGMIAPGESWELAIDEPGVVQVFCEPHGSADGTGMAGVIIAGDPTPESLGASQVAADLRGTVLAEIEELAGAIDGQAGTAQDIRSRIAALSRELGELRATLDGGSDDPQALGDGPGTAVLGAATPDGLGTSTGAGLLGLALGIGLSALYVATRARTVSKGDAGLDQDADGAG